MKLGAILHPSNSPALLTQSGKHVKLVPSATAQRKIVVHPVRREHQESLAQMVRLVSLAHLANPVCLATTHQFHWMPKENAAGAHQDHLALPAPRAQQDQLESKESPVCQASQARMDHKDHLDHPAQQAPKPQMESPATRENPAKMRNEATKDHPDQRAKQENPDQRDQMERRDHKRNPAHQELLDHPVHQAQVANQETKDRPAHLVPQERLVWMPTIVLARDALPRMPRRRQPKWPRKHKKGEHSMRMRSSDTLNITVGLTGAFNGDYSKCSNPVLLSQVFNPLSFSLLGYGSI